jgi:hypothetical protein
MADEKLKEYYQKINQYALIIFQNIYSNVEPKETFWELSKEYQNNKIGNYEYYKSLIAAIELFGYETQSEMLDMIEEFDDIGLVVISF